MSYLIGVSNINVLTQGNVILTLLKLQINKGFLSASVLGFITSIFKILVEVRVSSIAGYEFRDCSLCLTKAGESSQLCYLIMGHSE